MKLQSYYKKIIVEESGLIAGMDNIPKEIIERSNALSKSLFGASISTLGESLVENIRKRQLTNEIKILSKVGQILEDEGKKPGKVPLKVMAPLISQSSLEEDESLQNKWARLIAHILTEEQDTIFHQNCINILNKISSEDAKLLDSLHIRLHYRRDEYFAKRKAVLDKKYSAPDELSLGVFSFSIYTVSNDVKMPKQRIEFSLSNLATLGLIKWETEVAVTAEKANDEPEDKSIDVDVTVSNNDEFIFTPLGDKFVRICQSPR